MLWGMAVNTFLGLIIRTDGPQFTVRDEQGRHWRCVLRGRLRQELHATTSPVAVGDRVAITGEGVDGLRGAIAGKLVAFVGPSGAGKSSLLNTLDPTLGLRVGGLAASGKGGHATNWASVCQVDSALVVDTPGLDPALYNRYARLARSGRL